MAGLVVECRLRRLLSHHRNILKHAFQPVGRHEAGLVIVVPLGTAEVLELIWDDRVSTFLINKFKFICPKHALTSFYGESF